VLRGTDVELIMTRVATALAKASHTPGGGPIVVHREGDDGLGIARLRDQADIRMEFHSGSDRPVVGPAVRLAKRAVRRGLRWYLAPMTKQQSEFNHAVLDLVETLRLRNERLVAEVEAWRAAIAPGPPAIAPTPRARANGRLPAPDNDIGNAGIGDTGNGDTGNGDTGNGDIGIGDTGIGGAGIGDAATGDTGIGDTGIGDTGIGDTGIGDTGIGDNGGVDPSTG
jgi:hypothetical protein